MTNIQEDVAQQFYTAFAKKDYLELARFYHNDLSFTDPAFGTLSRSETLAMWEMLFTSADDLDINFKLLTSGDNFVVVEWRANYSFGSKKRFVKNIIKAKLLIEDDLIIRHIDSFNLYRWSRQAMGIAGWLIGWTGFFRRKLQKQTRSRLASFISKKSNIK